MKRTGLALVVLLILVSVSVFAQIAPVPQLLSFQGRLAKPDGTPVADGNYQIRFSFWDAAAAGTEKWNQTLSLVAVRNGTFAVLLNTSTGAVDKFNGNLWLEVKLGTDAPLTPRQPLVSVAYAMKANSVSDNAINSASIANGSIAAADLAPNTLNSLSWLLGGNSGTSPASHFIGTTDNQPLIFKANNALALRLAWATGAEINGINIIGGHSGNNITTGATVVTIAGGGYFKVEGASLIQAYNRVTDTGGTIGGGASNRAGDNDSNPDDAIFATISGGIFNLATGDYAMVGGGYSNEANGDYSAVGGGRDNRAAANYTTVGGGINNTAFDFYTTVAGGSGNDAHDDYATVGGGYSNFAEGQYSVIAGGYNNAIGAGISTNYAATIGGGAHNFVELDYATVSGGSDNIASGSYATVPGGYDNAADADYTFAAGRRAKANHTGSLVWADSTNADFASTASNQFLIRAANGVGINTNAPAGYTLNVGGDLRCIGFFNASDARWKRNIAALDNSLDTLLNLRGVSYAWKPTPGMEFPDGRQIGFIAQEVEKVLPELVSTDANGYKSVAYANVVPVLVEAIKTLKKDADEKQKQIETLNNDHVRKDKRLSAIEIENSALKQQLSELREIVRQVKATQEALGAHRLGRK